MTLTTNSDFAFTARLPETIVTDRLVLRAPGRVDAKAMARLANNQRIHKWLRRMPYPYRREHAIAFIDDIARGGDDFAFSILTADGDFIGVAGFHPMDDSGIELGYWLGEPYWGEGYATEAATALIDAALRAGCRRLFARAQSSNAASRKILQKIGFIKTDERIDDCGPHKGVMITFYKLAKRS